MTLLTLPTAAAITVGVLWLAGYHTAALTTAVLAVIAYVLQCAYWPWGPCWWCTAGRQWSPVSQGFRRCRRCGGRGERVRLGRRIWTGATDINEDRK